LIEKVLKVLDFFTKEKIVRIILLLLENLLCNDLCIEIIGENGGVELLAKLVNRHWVDKDIDEMLEKQVKKVEENYHVFTSIVKLKKEIQRGFFKWSPVHSERFWQENFIMFHEIENLDLIRTMVGMLEQTDLDDISRAVICYDLGEFSKYFPAGKQFLERLKVKEKVYNLMS
jgi:V-type H+-transporting ATPase subunit H